MADATDPKKDKDAKKDPKAEVKADPKTAPKAEIKTDAKAGDKAAKPADKKADPSAGTADKKPDTPADAAAKPGQKTSSVPPSGPSSDPQPAAEAKSGGGGRAFVVLVVIIAAIAGGGYVTRDVWSPVVTPYLEKFVPGNGGTAQTPADTAGAQPALTVEERLAALERKIAADNAAEMDALKGEAARAQAELDKALTRIDDLERRLTELREVASALTSSSASGSADLSSVMTRIDGLEEGRRANAAEIKALTDKIAAAAVKQAGSSAGSGVVLALAQVRDAALAGHPYGAQLDALIRVAGDNPDVMAAASRLKDRADAGLPTADALADRFTGIAADILVKTRAASDSWIDQTTAKLAGLVSLRRTDGRSGDTVEDAVADIERKLARRDLAAAAETASGLADALPRPALDVFEPWLLDLKARVGAERALDAMRASALAALDGK